MPETRVVNLRHSQCDQLIDRTTIFGNPFPEWKYGREECIKKFETYFYGRIERDPVWKAEVLKLMGKALGCWCKHPDREVGCHGDVYVAFLESYEQIETLREVSK